MTWKKHVCYSIQTKVGATMVGLDIKSTKNHIGRAISDLLH